METAHGTVTLAQEGRMQLHREDGGYLDFVLSHRAATDESDVEAMARDQSRVRVRYSEAPGLLAMIAYEVTRQPKPDGAEG